MGMNHWHGWAPGFAHPGWFGFGWIGMAIGMVLFWAVILLLAVYLIRLLGRDSSRKEPSSLLAILQERYARGEIDREQFEAAKRDLRL